MLAPGDNSRDAREYDPTTHLFPRGFHCRLADEAEVVTDTAQYRICRSRCSPTRWYGGLHPARVRSSVARGPLWRPVTVSPPKYQRLGLPSTGARRLGVIPRREVVRHAGS